MIKAIFFDVDGTLLDGGAHLSSKVEYALKELNKKDIAIFITTGRGPLTVPKFDGINIDGYITYNGAFLYSNRFHFVYGQAIPKESVSKIIDNARRFNKGISLCNELMIISDYVDKEMKEYCLPDKVDPTMVKDLKEHLNQNIYQIMVSSSLEERNDILKDVFDVIATSSSSIAADYIYKGCNKGVAVNYILKCLNINKDEAMAFGDGKNDISMFESVGTSIAMANADMITKNAASEITKSIKEDGVYYCLKKKGIID